MANEILPPKADVSNPVYDQSDHARSAPEKSEGQESGQHVPESKGPKKSQCLELAELASSARADVFRDENDDYYLVVAVGTHQETHRLRSRYVRNWARDLWLKARMSTLTDRVIDETLSTWEAVARQRPIRRVYLRIAEVPDVLYLDLGNDAWDAVRIDSQNVVTMPTLPIHFVRGKSVRSLPNPDLSVVASDLEPLLGYILNLDGDALRLIVVWMLTALSRGPYSILFLSGPEDSAKTTRARLIRASIDPANPLLRALPATHEGLSLAARSSLVQGFDNLSAPLRNADSDALATLVTGGALGRRTLFSDDEESVFQATRPVILTSIDSALLSRADLASRTIVISTTRPTTRRTNADIDRDFAKAAPSILGAICDALRAILATRESTKVRVASDVRMQRIRMADAARWVSGAEAALGWPEGETMRLLAQASDESIDEFLAGDSLASALIEFANREGAREWRGTSAELLPKLELLPGRSSRDSRGQRWPKNPEALGHGISRLIGPLARVGVKVERTRSGSRREISIRLVGDGR
ncbi:MAG: hypothetical protein HYV07_12170 [Deltaproteobacteria bacterium]|nr:hypothetical protein [Deltaproteobacteria bacterium]